MASFPRFFLQFRRARFTQSLSRPHPLFTLPAVHYKLRCRQECFEKKGVPGCSPCPRATREEKPMDRLTLFGLFAVTAMLVTYALENRSRWFILAFAGSCILGSIYGFLQGAWPFGVVEGIWSVVAARRWWRARIAR